MNSKIKPSEIYVDWGRDCTTVWTNTGEMFTTRNYDLISIATQIRNLVSYVLINKKTNEEMVRQDIKVYVDKTGAGATLIDILTNQYNIVVEPISNGTWLKEFTKELTMIKLDDEEFNIIKKQNTHKELRWE